MLSKRGESAKGIIALIKAIIYTANPRRKALLGFALVVAVFVFAVNPAFADNIIQENNLWHIILLVTFFIGMIGGLEVLFISEIISIEMWLMGPYFIFGIFLVMMGYGFHLILSPVPPCVCKTVCYVVIFQCMAGFILPLPFVFYSTIRYLYEEIKSGIFHKDF